MMEDVGRHLVSNANNRNGETGVMGVDVDWYKAAPELRGSQLRGSQLRHDAGSDSSTTQEITYFPRGRGHRGPEFLIRFPCFVGF